MKVNKHFDSDIYEKKKAGKRRTVERKRGKIGKIQLRNDDFEWVYPVLNNTNPTVRYRSIVAEVICTILIEDITASLDLRDTSHELARSDMLNENTVPIFSPERYKNSLNTGTISIGNKKTRQVYAELMKKMQLLFRLTGSEDLVEKERSDLKRTFGKNPYNINYKGIPMQWALNKTKGSYHGGAPSGKYSSL